MADGHGGARSGAGRKPKAVTNMRRQALEAAGADAERAFAFVIDRMEDPKAGDAVRLACAQIIMDRVWGKPTQRNENNESGELLVRVVYEDDNSQTGTAAPSPASGRG